MALLRVEKYGDIYRLLKMSAKKSSDRTYVLSEDPHSGGERFANNIARARGKILEYGYCNSWEYFCTLTLDGAKNDRYDLKTYVKDLGIWINSYNRKYGCKLKYLLIPEQHKDGAYHMHGLLSGVSAQSLVRNEYNYLDIPFYRKRFGYISLSRLKSKDNAVSYITKYISKGMSQTEIESGYHLFYASRGLAVKEIISEYFVPDDFSMVYENDYCGISWLDNELMIAEGLANVEKFGMIRSVENA